MLDRRTLLVASASLAASAARAQPRPRVIGLLSPYSSEQARPFRDVLLRAMFELGYRDGKEFVLVERYADGRDERLRELAGELVKLKVDLIYASSTNAVAAAQRTTRDIPIVFESVADPVLAGFADSISHPGRNITGLLNFSGDLHPKRLQMLRQIVPSLASIAALMNPTNPYYASSVQRIQYVAHEQGVRAMTFAAARHEELAPAFKSMIEQGAGAVYVSPDAYLWFDRQRIAELALAGNLPSMCPFADYVEAGALMSYGADPASGIRAVAGYVDRIFRGAKPGELPIEQPTRLELVINRKTANALKLTIPQTLVLQAAKLIE